MADGSLLTAGLLPKASRVSGARQLWFGVVKGCASHRAVTMAALAAAVRLPYVSGLAGLDACQGCASFAQEELGRPGPRERLRVPDRTACCYREVTSNQSGASRLSVLAIAAEQHRKAAGGCVGGGWVEQGRQEEETRKHTSTCDLRIVNLPDIGAGFPSVLGWGRQTESVSQVAKQAAIS